MITTIGINGNHYLPESEDKKDFKKKISQLDTLETLLFKNTETNELPGIFSQFEKRKKTRLLVKRGVANIVLFLNDVVAIYTTNKLMYVVDKDSKKYSIDKTLTELEEELDPTIFFRANRQFIININFVKSFKAYRRVKLIVDFNIPELEYRVCISQHVAPSFKKWMNDA
ncbi:MAG: LytTR family DNA-binding domain-containing protein [Ginsengibacter sp.]